MKKALLTMALLVVPFFSRANIFDTASNSVEPKIIQSCELSQTPQEKKAQWNNAVGHPRWIGNVKHNSAATGITSTGTRYPSDGYCEVTYRISYTTSEYDNNGQLVRSYTNYSESMNGRSIIISGVPVEAPQCMNLDSSGGTANQENTYLGKKSDGTFRCYTPQDLADADTCEEKNSDGLYESFQTSESGVSCISKDDGSVCPVKKSFEITTSGGNTSHFYDYNPSQPQSCYQANNIGEESTPPFENEELPDVGECKLIGGYSVCGESPINVCDSNGNCSSGCGAVDVGDGPQFMCFSGDIDGDTIPDYLDRDKDGDGIINEDDLDADGDGVEDSITTGSKVRSPHQSSVEQLLAQIAQNTSGGTGGGGGTGASASQIGESVAEEIEDKLVEQADFTGTEFEQSINTKIENTDTSIDEFLQNNEKDLTNAFDESQFEGSYSSLKAALSPNACSAQFGIPFTSSNLDLCEPASKAQPFLYVIFAISTFIYCMRRIQSTARSE